jgi:transposase
MNHFRLEPPQRRRLLGLLQATSDLNVYRRCLALLEVGAGRAVADVARALGVTRQSVHNWIARFGEVGGTEALADRYRGGRPTTLGPDGVEGLVALLGHSPQHFGSPAANWTVPLLREHLRRATGADASEPTVRRQLRRLGYVWKRPRYVLDPDPEREEKTPDRSQAAVPAGYDRHPGRG